ncbi:hypothetical protein ACHAXR_009337 [Thalassiosira sp. AJA248-18]
MARSIMLHRAFLLLVSITQLVVNTSLSSRASSAVILTISLAPFTLISADDNAEENNVVDAAATTAAAAGAAATDQECKESDDGTCSSKDGDETNTSTSDSSSEEIQSSQDDDTTKNDITTTETTAQFGPNGDRLITPEEIALHTGVGGASPDNPIWLSILGKVYDVTAGEDFYGATAGSYKFYAGRDATPCFSSGNNTPEGAAEKLEEWEDKKLMSAWEWSTFYEEHETYKYLGILAGSRYYDESGNELPLRQDIVNRSSEAKKAFDVEKERKKKERMEKREARKKNKK